MEIYNNFITTVYNDVISARSHLERNPVSQEVATPVVEVICGSHSCIEKQSRKTLSAGPRKVQSTELSQTRWEALAATSSIRPTSAN